ncbi:NUDIX domain-containing protein [Olsenella massiliensis]|uniref:NUDIX domain-containing protein n=1 Tax=Olsenella massiliensis TaxID=1622075 RepID=UPI00071C97B8|nr:NUDIX hydrolase [Olsenella massiliensis]
MDDAMARDAHGLTEAEFLAGYRPKDYPRPSLTADVCVFRRTPQGATHLLLIRRGAHPCLGRWATPGGFCNPDESADHCAARELAEETGVANLDLEPLALYSAPGRDPRGWVVSYAFVAWVDEDVAVRAGDDAERAGWFCLDARRREDVVTLALSAGDVRLSLELRETRAPLTGCRRAQVLRQEGLAFDHARIVADAWLLLHDAGRL